MENENFPAEYLLWVFANASFAFIVPPTWTALFLRNLVFLFMVRYPVEESGGESGNV
jgi:hypothetical protein